LRTRYAALLAGAFAMTILLPFDVRGPSKRAARF
jgi:hypothetical protein